MLNQQNLSPFWALYENAVLSKSAKNYDCNTNLTGTAR